MSISALQAAGTPTSSRGCETTLRTANGVRYVGKYANAVISGHVVEKVDCGTHTIFIADVTEASVLSDAESVTYQYYFDPCQAEKAAGARKEKGLCLQNLRLCL